MTREDEIRARLDAATPGPWHWFRDHLVWPSENGPAANDPICGVNEAHAECADLIGHAPDDLRWLLAEVERLSDEVADATMRIRRLNGKRKGLEAKVARIEALAEVRPVPDGNGRLTTWLADALFNVWADMDPNEGDYEAGQKLADAAMSVITDALKDEW